MKALFKTLSTGALLLAMLSAAAQESVFPPGEFVFMWEDREAYLIANQAPLNKILTEISMVVGIPIEADPDDESLITTDLRAKSLEQIINSIAPSSVIMFARAEDAGEYVVERIRTTIMGDPVAAINDSRQRVVEENGLEKRLRNRHRRPVKFVGIGVNVSPTKDRAALWIKPIDEQTPAYKAGLRMGDRLLAIDGKRIDQFTNLGLAIRAIRGKPETSIRFLVLRPDGTQTYKTVVRDLVEYDPRERHREH